MVLILMLIIVKYSPSMSTVPVMYQVSSIEWPVHLNHLHDKTRKKIAQTLSSSPHYSRVAGVYTKLEEKVMDAPVYQKLDLFTGKTEQTFLFRKYGGRVNSEFLLKENYFLDWMVGISSSPQPLLSTTLHYAIPSLLNTHRNTTLPCTYGWMFLSMAREWQYDNMIRVIPHLARNTSSTSPCSIEYNTDYVGQELARTR